jgi:DNA-binding NtrC family response regulator
MEQKKRLLILDDDITFSKLLKQLLEKKGYTVDTITTGEAAIKSYRTAMESSNPYDGLLIDLTLVKGIDGKTTIKKLLEIDPDVVAIVCSGYTDLLAMKRYQNFGFKGKITKPFRMKELEQVLEKIFEKV